MMADNVSSCQEALLGSDKPPSIPPPCDDAEAAKDKDRRQKVLRKLMTASLLCIIFFVGEVIVGLLAGSLAVLSDAAHLAADLVAFIIAIIGFHIASLPASASHTFGLMRTESLAALFSMVCLVILSILLAVEATYRIWIISHAGEEEFEVNGKLMSIIASVGVVVNVVLAFILGEDHAHLPGMDHDDCHHDHDIHDHDDHDHDDHDHDHNNDDHFALDSPFFFSSFNSKCCQLNDGYDKESHIDHPHEESAALISTPHLAVNEDLKLSVAKKRNVNLHAAYIHVLADLAQSVVVLVAGLIIWYEPTWQLVDPICTLIFSFMVCYGTLGVFRSNLSVLLEEVPPGIIWDDVFDTISAVEGVKNVHDLHIWSISHGKISLSVHATAVNVEQAYHDIKTICHQKEITHLTMQLLPSTVEDCITCPGGMAHQCIRDPVQRTG